MAVTDRVRTLCRQIAPPTSDRLDESRFLLAGAAAGLLGWGGTQALGWLDPPNAPLAATALWAVLVFAFGALTVGYAPDGLRFSDPMLVWGAANGTAMALTVGSLVGVVPARLGIWVAWAGASTLGYLGTGALLVRAGAARRGRGYLAVGGVALAVLALGIVAVETVAPVAPLLLGAVHVVPLVLDARTRLSPAARGLGLGVVVAALLVARLLVL